MSTPQSFEALRFSLVRNPQEMDLEQDLTSISSYPRYIEKVNQNSSFISNLIAELEPRTTEAFATAVASVNSFHEGDSFLSDKSAININNSNILDAYKLLSGSELSTETLVSDLNTILGESFLTDLDREETIMNRLQLWDNLIVNLFKGLESDHKKQISNALRTYHTLDIIQEYNAAGEEINIEEVKQAVNSILQSPKGIFPLQIQTVTEEGDSTDFDTLKTHYDSQLIKLQGFNTAKEELDTQANYYRNLALDYTSDFVPVYDENNAMTNAEEQPDLPNFTHLTSERFEGLTSETQTIIQDLGYSTEAGRTYAALNGGLKTELNKVIQDLYKADYAVVKSTIENGVEILLEGGGGLTIPTNGSHTAPVGLATHGGLTQSYTPGTLAPVPFPEPSCTLKPVSVGDYLKVEKEWKCYEPGEVAHIENILKGELKERSTRNLRVTEESYSIETIKESEVVRDLQTTERFSLTNEISKQTQKELEANVNAYVNGKSPMVQFGVQAGLAYSQSYSESTTKAKEYAQETIERAVKRVVERTREEKTIKVIEEFEENNVHKIDNVAGADHTVGIFRWVDKIYECKLINYGRRVMFEFMISEPAAFHIFAKKANPSQSVILENPVHPSTGVTNPLTNASIPLKAATDIKESNYQILASAYGADVSAPPRPKTLSKSFGKTGMPDESFNVDTNNVEFALPEGYVAKSASLIGDFPSQSWRDLSVGIGNRRHHLWAATLVNGAINLPLSDIEEVVPVSVWSIGPAVYYIHVSIEIEASDALMEKWKNDTFNSIMDAYYKKKNEYDAAIQQATFQQGIQIQGSNPGEYREIEKRELKKNCIRMLNRNYDYLSPALTGGNNYYYHFNATEHPADKTFSGDNYPYINNCESIKEGKHVKFFEDLFDWDIMSYEFFPYFWGNRNRWIKNYSLDGNDPLFSSFLKAGFAKVVVPVSLGFEDLALQFLETGNIHQGTPVTLSDLDNISALADFKNTLDNPTLGAAPAPDPDTPLETWEIRMPTNLVILQGGGTDKDEPLGEGGLPCKP